MSGGEMELMSDCAGDVVDHPSAMRFGSDINVSKSQQVANPIDPSVEFAVRRLIPVESSMGSMAGHATSSGSCRLDRCNQIVFLTASAIPSRGQLDLSTSLLTAVSLPIYVAREDVHERYSSASDVASPLLSTALRI
jgi:hypothetical protein